MEGGGGEDLKNRNYRRTLKLGMIPDNIEGVLKGIVKFTFTKHIFKNINHQNLKNKAICVSIFRSHSIYGPKNDEIDVARKSNRMLVN